MRRRSDETSSRRYASSVRPPIRWARGSVGPTPHEADAGTTVSRASLAISILVLHPPAAPCDEILENLLGRLIAQLFGQPFHRFTNHQRATRVRPSLVSE